jgi:hypothetical protein
MACRHYQSFRKDGQAVMEDEKRLAKLEGRASGKPKHFE